VLGAILAAALLYFITSGKAGFDLSGGLASMARAFPAIRWPRPWLGVVMTF
jgi:hypothetical protein